MRTQSITLPSGVPGYEAVPDERPRAAVVVIQEAFGLNSHIERIARDLAVAGYHAVAPNMFHRTGGGTVPYFDFSKVLEHYAVLDDAALLHDVDAALDHLRAAGFEDRRIGIVGFCMGGRVTFLTAARRAIGAGVGFYGGGIVTQRMPQFAVLVGESASLKTPWLGLFGDKDQSIPVADVERLRDALEAAPVETEIVRFPNAGHGFHCDQRADFEPESAADAWKRTLAWFERFLAM